MDIRLFIPVVSTLRMYGYKEVTCGEGVFSKLEEFWGRDKSKVQKYLDVSISRSLVLAPNKVEFSDSIRKVEVIFHEGL